MAVTVLTHTWIPAFAGMTSQSIDKPYHTLSKQPLRVVVISYPYHHPLSLLATLARPITGECIEFPFTPSLLWVK